MNANAGFKSAATRLIAPVLGMLMLAASPSKASPISYIIDRSNAFPDDVAYLQVTIDDGAAGAIDFTVQVLDALTGAAATNFGIQSFAFNVIPGSDAEGASVGNLPAGWITRDHYRMSEYGFFDIKLYGGGNSRLQTLTFSILGIEGDTPADYAVLSTGNAPDGHSFFSARVADITLPGCEKKCPTSAFFAGNAPVPLPGAAWLFATGAAAVVARSRKRSRS